MNRLPAQKVDGLIDGMAVLQELAADRNPVSGLALSKKLNMSPVRVNRLLKTFAYLGYAYQTASRKYAVGPGIHVMAAQTMAASGLLRRAFEYLELLSREAPTVALGVLWKRQVCYLFHKGRNMAMGAGIGGHSLYAAEDSSIGMALLAELHDDRVRELYRGENIEPLLEELARTRRNGYALLRHHDHYSLGVAIGQPAYAALAVSGITGKEAIPPLLEKLREYSAGIERQNT